MMGDGAQAIKRGVVIEWIAISAERNEEKEGVGANGSEAR